jgi:hypothetical protein
MSELGKFLAVIGLLLAGAAVLLLRAGVGRGFLGRWPGDIHYTKFNNTTVRSTI